MLDKLFKKKSATSDADYAKLKIEENLLRAIEKQKKTDPLAGVKIGAKELVQILMNASKNERGIHIDSLLAIIGSLAGFSCQMAIRKGVVQTGKITMKQAFMEVMATNGKKYYFGDLLNEPLITMQYSVWKIAAGGAQSIGLKQFPDLNEMLKYCVSTVGSEQFGKPRLPDGHNISDMPINYVQHLWNPIFPTLNKFCDSPSQWPVMLGIAAQNAIVMSKGTIDPLLALTIIMECAIPASKFDPLPLGISV